MKAEAKKVKARSPACNSVSVWSIAEFSKSGRSLFFEGTEWADFWFRSDLLTICEFKRTKHQERTASLFIFAE